MGGRWGAMLRRVRLRSLVEGLVQVLRAEATDDDAKDGVERWQDYGLAGNPGDGQGLVLNVDGHTVVVRMDRIAERPQLATFEVAVWHKEGHFVKLKAGRVVEVDCDQLLVHASTKVRIVTPTFEVSSDNATVQASAKVQVTAPEVEVDASSGASITTPTLAASAAVTVGTTLSATTAVEAPTVAAATSLTVDGVEMAGHGHSDVEHGTDNSGPPTEI